jgi:pimeloyl-ACP methyl ester carboxylesterase
VDAAFITATTVASIGALITFSYAIEALRPHPQSPQRLPWAPGISLEYATLGGVRVRYIRAGTGPPVVLLHTLRTQLDIFQMLVSPLAAHFTVYAFDYPGHGWSDIPQAAYAPEDFYRWTAAFLDELHIEHVTLAGLSIGGTIALVLAARQHPRVARVVAINPYDYPPAGGIRHSSLMARMILGPAAVPLVGSTLMRLRNRFISDRIMEGGVACASSLSAELKKELYEAGARPGHYRGFLSLLAHEAHWSQAKEEYPRIRVPTLLVYGDQDWAPERLREDDRRRIPDVTATSLHGGHFLSLDQPRGLAELITQFGLATHT